MNQNIVTFLGAKSYHATKEHFFSLQQIRGDE